jgi:Leucine-rich repeat (LRR) protein
MHPAFIPPYHYSTWGSAMPFLQPTARAAVLAVLLVASCQPPSSPSAPAPVVPPALGHATANEPKNTQPPVDPVKETPRDKGEAKTPEPEKEKPKPPEPENPVVARVKKLGGKAKVDDKAPGKPVVEIDLSNLRINDDDLAILAEAPTLRVLHLTQSTVTAKGLEHVRNLKDLEVLTFLNCNLADEGMKHLAGLTRLRVLVTSASVTDKGFAELKGLTEMRDLSLSFGTTDKTLEVVKGFRKLEKLKLFGSYTSKGTEQLRGMPELRELDLSMSSIGPDGIPPLAELPKLRALELGNGGPKSNEKMLPAVRKLKNLEKLRLASLTGDEDAELEHLGEMEKLTELDLYGLKLTDQSLEKLATLKNLTYLSLSGKGITDEGLLKLKPLVNLRRLQLAGTSTTSSGIDKLRKTLTTLGVGRTPF